MRFIELTSDKTGRTFHMCTEYIGFIDDYVNDDDGVHCTRVRLGTNEDDVLYVTETPEEVLRRIKESELKEMRDQSESLMHLSQAASDWEKIVAERRKRIDDANVSEAAKAFYREHAFCPFSKGEVHANNLDDAYALLRELDDAKLIMARIVFLDP